MRQPITPDRIGKLTLENELQASGKVTLISGAADSGALLGWFNSKTPHGGPPPNFIGIMSKAPAGLAITSARHFAIMGREGKFWIEVPSSGPILHPTHGAYTIRRGPMASGASNRHPRRQDLRA